MTNKYNVRISVKMSELIEVEASNKAQAIEKAKNISLTSGIGEFVKSEYFDGVDGITFEE